MGFGISLKPSNGRKFGIDTETFKLGINFCLIIGLMFCLSSCSVTKTTPITVDRGATFRFTCCYESTKNDNNFAILSPQGKYYSMHEGYGFENGRIYVSQPTECEVTVESAIDDDEGVWECHVYDHHLLGQTTSVLRHDIVVSLSSHGRDVFPVGVQRPPSNEAIYGTTVFGWIILGGVVFCCIIGCILYRYNFWCCQGTTEEDVNSDTTSDVTDDASNVSNQTTTHLQSTEDPSDIFSRPVSPDKDDCFPLKKVPSLTMETGCKLPDTGSPVCSSSSVANNNRCYGISQEKPSRNSVFLSENVDRLDNSNESFAFPTIKDKMSTPSLVPLSNSLESNNLEDSYTSPIDTKHSSLINSGGAVDSNLNKHVEYKSERTISKYDVDSNEPSNVDVDEGSSGIKNTEDQVIGGESHVDDKTHEGKDETSLSSDHENEKTYTMEIENDANITENPQESVLNGSKRSSILSPSLLFNMFLEKYSDVKTRRHNQPR